MKNDHGLIAKPETAADALLHLLASRGIEYLFANGGTDFAPVAEAYAKGRRLGSHLPKVVLVPHENLGVAMAHGYTMISGQPQAMMVHVGVGSANALNGLINAARTNTPLIFMAGRTPITESGMLPGARNNYIHWAQEHFDQGGMLREFMKWDYELRHAEQVETVFDRAIAIAKSEPRGPVYVALPREILASTISGLSLSETPTIQPASPPAADPDTVEQVAKLLGRADRPLIITSSAGRSVKSAHALQRLAEAFAIPVVQYRPRNLALPTDHPLAAGWDPHSALQEADLVLAIECDVPWIPALGQPRSEAKIVHIGTDPLFSRYPLRGFRTDLALTGALASTLDTLCERTQKHAKSPAKIADQRKEVTLRNSVARDKARSGISGTPAAITGKWASACLNAVMDEDTILVNESPVSLEELTIGGPMRYFGTPPSSGLGWGVGAALGAKLASPRHTVIAALGDGAYMFGNPTPGHFVGEAMHLPVLYVIFNNSRWAAVHRATLTAYPEGFASKEAEPPFTVLEPSPRFEQVIQASGGHGEHVTAPKELMPALERAMKVVRDEKRQALVNVCLQASYIKTS